ncbi:hypothetical protein GCM10028778_11800 [Barrientosiimonas marina]|uniref:Phage major capsid protein n=1 Tax=Lentibacillus kimchii TaxID=1542911 RepID=A0ABW2V053_9BACI
MDYNNYIEQRNQLMNEAEQLIGEQKIEESEEKMNEVKQLDDNYEQAKAKQADLNALKDNEQVVNFDNKTENVKGGKEMANLDNTNYAGEQVDYKTAWAKHMMNQTLNEQEQQVFNEMNNAYTHDTGNTSTLIPETVAQGIFQKAQEQYPFLEAVKKFAVEGHLTLNKHDAVKSGDAKFYDEDTETELEENQFGTLNLTGKEISKAVQVSWKLQTMSIQNFMNFLTDELGRRVGMALGTAVINGKGDETEPEGLLTKLEAESKTPQITKYTDEITYQDVTNAISKVHSTYLNDVGIYANNATVWNQLANITDGNGRPLFIPEPSESSIGRIFGKRVFADAGVPDNYIIIGSAKDGMVFNTNRPFEIVTEQHARKRTTDMVAYSIVDSGVLDSQAFSVLKKGSGGGGKS